MQIINWRTCLKFPEEPKISNEAKDLICHLLCDVETRLGTRGVEEIKVKRVVFFTILKKASEPFLPFSFDGLQDSFGATFNEKLINEFS